MGSIISGIGSAIGSGAASRKADAGASVINNSYRTAAGNLQPFIDTGRNVLDPYQAAATSGLTGGGPDYVSRADAMLPGQMTQAELEATPGYQFTLGQGLQAVQGSAAARGLGVSGAALKGAASYATGLANQTYKDQFAIAQQRYSDVLGLNTAQQGNITNSFNRLANASRFGLDAATGLGKLGLEAATGTSEALTAAGGAQATGTSALAKGFGDTTNQVLGTAVTPGGSSLGQNVLQWATR